VIYNLAQAVAEAAEAATVLGFTADQWVILLPAIAAFLATVIPLWRSASGAKGKLSAVLHAVEETGEEHPEAGGIVKAAVMRKAKKLGVESGLNKEVKRVTARRKNGGKL